MIFALAFLALVSVGAGGLRWLRVAQREHYLAGSVTRFALRWWWLDMANRMLALLIVAGLSAVVAGWWVTPAAVIVLVAATVGPVGLRLKGTTSKLAWTARLRRVAGATLALWLLVAGAAVAFGSVALLLAAVVGSPLLFDLALLLLQPVERRLGAQWVTQATKKLKRIDPVVVAITGSYGKTTTKEYVKRILGASRPTVASPASFNNRMGLARAINEQLTPGTEIFIAEMGTYGPGEIADMCSWIPPTVGVITAIGPVHLERFGSLDRTLAAKAEILAGAQAAVLNIDDERLSALAGRISNNRIITCSAEGAEADVSLVHADGRIIVRVDGAVIAKLPDLPLASNLACAIGVALAIDAPLDRLAASLADAATPQHRQSVYQSEAGFTIIDDTYNSNPAGVRAALATLEATGSGRRVVVTPGMVELGGRQFEENRIFGSLAARVASDVVIVGRTNLRALREGTKEGPASVIVMPSREKAVEWVKANLSAGDAVLYENDLPDHYA